MKIYFAGSIRGGRQDKELYLHMILHMQTHGDVLTEHVGNPELSHIGEDGPNDTYIYERDMHWLHTADAVIAEVSTPSLGVGYEVAMAEMLKKPLLCLWRKNPNRPLSAMISGCKAFRTVTYDTFEEATNAIDEFISQLKKSAHHA